MKTKKSKRTTRKRQRGLRPATCWTARLETPRTDAAEKTRQEYLSQLSSEQIQEGFKGGLANPAFKEWLKNVPPDGWDTARRIEQENAILCDFINREMGMTAADPRVTELEQAIAALSNDKRSEPAN